MSKCCVICVGRNADRAADRIEAYAKKADFEIVETIFKDTKSVERLKFYIERDSIISILVSSIYDISSDKDVVKLRFKGKRKLTQEMVDLFVAQVRIYENKNLEIVLNYEDELKKFAELNMEREAG